MKCNILILHFNVLIVQLFKEMALWTVRESISLPERPVVNMQDNQNKTVTGIL